MIQLVLAFYASRASHTCWLCSVPLGMFIQIVRDIKAQLNLGQQGQVCYRTLVHVHCILSYLKCKQSSLEPTSGASIVTLG